MVVGEMVGARSFVCKRRSCYEGEQLQAGLAGSYLDNY